MTRAGQLIRSLLFNTVMYLWLVVLGVICAIPSALSRETAYRCIRFYCSNIFWLLETLCGLAVEVRGQIPTGDVVVVSKHQSFLDVLIHCRFLDRPQFVMKRELGWIPVFGFYAKQIGCAPINRGDRARATEQLEQGVTRSSDGASQMVIYPQGTRVPPGQKRRYKGGAGILYDRHGKTCVLAATNVGHFWPRRAILRRPGTAVVEYLSELPRGLSRQEFMARIETEIESASDRLSVEAGLFAGGSGQQGQNEQHG
ncbi:MAG: 1-acyl-sn-glycerol-3-phosphate acyltransferase [Paracoccaceae bacterium]|nr:1-acyl-sn-glycerol-3-phosphate acyltransferase [Paracoccaceae bacterium]MDE2912934.1 1-acyl-sn-glycerol-3-phosphate acyltransferase [Paracoccaceae bacterium]